MPKQVQFCCGSNHLEGYENYDSDCNINTPLPFNDDSVDKIFVEHGTEHTTTHNFLRFLDECRRILRVGGTIRICMPVLDRLSPSHARDIILGHGHEAAYSTLLIIKFLEAAGFRGVLETPRRPEDSHWKVITIEKDDLETARVEGMK